MQAAVEPYREMFDMDPGNPMGRPKDSRVRSATQYLYVSRGSLPMPCSNVRARPWRL
jgi:hypothetical protein